MARYDEATQEFFRKYAEQSEEEKPSEQIARKALSLARTVTKGGPPAPALARQATGAVIKHLIEKEGAASVLRVFQILNDHYAKSWWDWEPETLWRTLSEDHGLAADPELKNMVMALQLVVNTNQAHEHWHIFEKVGHAFNQNAVDFSTLQPLELDEIALTLKVLERIRPKLAFESEICGYIASAAKNAGVVYLAPDLFGEGCQDFLDEMGNDLELKAQVEKTWPKVVEGETALAIQLQRLDEVRRYLEGSR